MQQRDKKSIEEQRQLNSSNNNNDCGTQRNQMTVAEIFPPSVPTILLTEIINDNNGSV